LVVRTDRQVRLPGTDPDQRDAQLVAQEADQVQELPPPVALAREDVVQFIDFTDRRSRIPTLNCDDS
jgi:hypothetical protein